MTIDTTSSRNVILDAIRNGNPLLLPLPDIPHYPFP